MYQAAINLMEKCSCVGEDVERGIIPFSWGVPGDSSGKTLIRGCP